MPCITELYSLFYIKKTKIIQFSVYNELTYIALAHLIIEYGSFNGITLLFCTDSYSIKDVIMLINHIFLIVKNKYDIHCTIRYYNFTQFIYQ